ncbi:G-type lectin S-receptor-like serine/threonine-protein kinase At1g67520 [Rutidosis leptorrhynchoides]|uniref:G-type lectin S-receptor-like serine/threonine-protein kinase At1g67520 n=1 Tax=Rutidosis leptorrhynchoides TaxID=125765 RepID=UPI003A99C1E8
MASTDESHDSRLPESDRKKNHELPLFIFSRIISATTNFSNENFLGHGGFGPVYKGTSENGVAVAVKRQSQNSSQGLKEFKNEVKLISKLQHKNLVRLLGCCIHGEERILIYEYLQNKSLDDFLFVHSLANDDDDEDFMAGSLLAHPLLCRFRSTDFKILKAGQQLRDFDSLMSPNKIYTLSFFYTDYSSTNVRYFGIQFARDLKPKSVWLANRENPFSDSSGIFNLTNEGYMILSESSGLNITINTVKPSSEESGNISLTRSNHGNLVLKGSGEQIMWQSFDQPTDAFLRGMKVGPFGLKAKKQDKKFLNSWLCPGAASSGVFTLGIDQDDLDKLVIWRRDELTSTGEIGVNHAESDHSVSFIDNLHPCDSNDDNISEGCVPSKPSNCTSGEEFSTSRVGIISDEYWNCDSYYKYSASIGLSDCQDMCRKNCSCVAYKNYNDIDETGCQFLGKNETSMLQQKINEGRLNGTESYIRNSILQVQKKETSKNMMQLGLGVGGSIAFLIMNPILESGRKKNHELPLFSFSSIISATGNFSHENFLGQGGFGPVYKGTFENGVAFAVKRLSQKSNQGLKEFKNEVILISKLQHKNLVRLLGCCIHGEERILIYEYLQNKSLDDFLFDETKRPQLHWNIRLCIIEGIAQGLLYLHKYSRLKIIHRDLKASNVLLDVHMNPKISDFGTARIFGENEFEANTNRIVGTYGYMSPEYAMDGLFSEKSDVFSYGVMLLEILSGRKNIGFYHSNKFVNILGYAWELWKEDEGLNFVDPALRYIQIGLLCVQESAADRPTMLDVTSMLSNESMTLPNPKQPAFYNVSGSHDADKNDTLPRSSTKNQLTISDVESRCMLSNIAHVHSAYRENDLTIKFLQGINDSFAAICSQLLIVGPLPPVKKIFGLSRNAIRSMAILLVGEPEEQDDRAMSMLQQPDASSSNVHIVSFCHINDHGTASGTLSLSEDWSS